MSQVTRAASKLKFQNGDVPSESDFADLHDSVLWQDEACAGVNAQTGTTYTLVASDSNKIVSMNNASANTVTIPANSSVPFVAGKTIITLLQLGAGETTIAAGGGVTLRNAGTVGGQYKAATLIKIGTNEWVRLGAGAAVVLTQLATPSVTFIDSTSTTIHPQWGAITGATNYLVKVATTNSVGAATQVHSGPETDFNVTGLTNGVLYYVFIIPQGAGFADGNPGTAQRTTGDLTTTQLATPTLTLTADGSTTATAVWTNVANEEGYTVQVATNSAFTTGLQTYNAAPDETSHQFTGLPAGTLIYGRSKAVGDGIDYSDSAYGTDSDTTSAAASYVDIVYDDKDAALIVSNKVWSNSSNLTGFGDGEGLLTTALTGDFEIVVTMPNTPSGADYMMFGLRETAVKGTYSDMKVGFTVAPGNNVIQRITGGNPTGIGESGVAGMKMKITRIGDVFTLYKSVDAGATYTDLGVFGYNRSLPMYHIIDVIGSSSSQASNPQYKLL